MYESFNITSHWKWQRWFFSIYSVTRCTQDKGPMATDLKGSLFFFFSDSSHQLPLRARTSKLENVYVADKHVKQKNIMAVHVWVINLHQLIYWVAGPLYVRNSSNFSFISLWLIIDLFSSWIMFCLHQKEWREDCRQWLIDAFKLLFNLNDLNHQQLLKI